MRVLLDEQLSRRLRHLLIGHQVNTTAYQGWRGVVNGSLLALAESAGFEVLLTADQSMYAQQSMKGRKIALVVLSINDRKVHQARIASIALAIQNCSPGSVTFVDLS